MKIAAGSFTDIVRPNASVSRTFNILLASFWVSLFLTIWISGTSSLIPRPLSVINAYPSLLRQGLFVELMASIKTIGQGVLMATAMSLTLSYLTVLPLMRFPAEVYSKFRFMGLTGLTFLFTIIFGGGNNLKVALIIFFISTFFVTANKQVVSEVPRDELDYARTLRMSEWKVVYHVVIMERINEAFEILIQNAAIGWAMVAMVEGIVRSGGGIGAMLLNQNKHFKLEEVFAIQLLILVIGLAMDWILRYLKNIICPHIALERARR